MNFKQMSTSELTKYFLANRQNKEALLELRKRPGKTKITISATASKQELQIALKKALE